MTSLLIAALLWMPASAQSLADVAKRAEEQRAKATAEKTPAPKVITNADLKPDTRPRVEVPSTPAAAAADEKKESETKKDAPADADPKKSEAYWKQRATELAAQLAADEKAAAPGRAEIARLQRNGDAMGWVNFAARNQVESQVIQLQQEQKRLEDAVTADRTAIREFEEEGRRLGILPGWMRPR